MINKCAKDINVYQGDLKHLNSEIIKTNSKLDDSKMYFYLIVLPWGPNEIYKSNMD